MASRPPRLSSRTVLRKADEIIKLVGELVAYQDRLGVHLQGAVNLQTETYRFRHRVQQEAACGRPARL